MSTIGPAWLSKAIFYQIYPQSFLDTNADGIGDLPGIIAKLDYLERLGVNALWLNPCYLSPFFDAGYDVADYCRVAPRYGTNDELEQLFARAHERGIKVCLDLVAGHTSIEHEWFRQSCRPERNEYTDYFIWTNNAWDTGEGSGQNFIKGYSDRDGAYAINFFYSQPALNYGFQNPDPRYLWQQPTSAPGPQAVRRELRKIMKYWLDRGADGFRVDMASSLIKNDPDKRGVIELWRECRAWLDADYPEAVLIAEWGCPEQAIQAGYHVDFMIHFGVPGYPSLFFDEDIFRRRKLPTPFFPTSGTTEPTGGVNREETPNDAARGDFTSFLGSYMTQYLKIKGRGYISIPSANHDFQRPNWNRTKRDLKVIFAFLLTWPGIPVIYYGDEIGMRYQPDLESKEGGFGRTGTRTPMQWDDTPNAGFSTADPERLYLPVDPRPDRPTVAEAETDDASLLHHVRALVALRSSSRALGADGGIGIVFAERNSAPVVYTRYAGSERYLIVINPSKAARTLSLPAHLCPFTDAEALNVCDVELSLRTDEFTVVTGPVSYGLFRVS